MTGEKKGNQFLCPGKKELETNEGKGRLLALKSAGVAGHGRYAP
jgi:hypothetical protein